MLEKPMETEACAVPVLIWSRPERAAKGPAPSRSREQIAAAAVALADDEGLDAVSMRKVAARLGIGAATLYGYVLDKDELCDLMVDRVEGEDAPPTALSGDCRTDLRGLAHRIRNSIIRHPWMASLGASRPNFGPNSLAWIEYGLATMDGLSLTIDEKLVISEAVHAFVRGFAARELAEQQALQRRGLSVSEWARGTAPYLEFVVSSGSYPRFGQVVRDAEFPHVESHRHALFSLALDRILNGLLVKSEM